jgi:PAS domain S-box-containing protein/putative nucleotidyltransferase with HDIG domain
MDYDVSCDSTKSFFPLRGRDMTLHANTGTNESAEKSPVLKSEAWSLWNTEGYRFLVDHSKEIILVLNKRAKIIFANQRTLDDFGYSREELFGKSITYFLAKGSIRKALWALAQEFLGRPQPELELRAKTKSGETRFLTVAEGSAPVHENGKLVGLMISASDITERKKAEQKLRESEQKYRQLFTSILDAILLFDAESLRIIDANDSALQLYGYTRDELLALKLSDISGEPEKSLRTADDILTGKLLRIPFRYHRKKDGTVFPVEITVGSFDLLGRKVLYGIYRDITERKLVETDLRQAKDRIQKYLDIVGVMVVAVGRMGEITLVNARGCRILGYPEGELIGRNWFDVCVPARMREDVRKVFQKLMAGDVEPVEFFENPVLTRGGEERTIAWHNSVLNDDAGRIIGTLSSGEDITGRKLTEDALVHSEQKYRELANALPSAIFEIDLNGGLIFANRTAFDWFGYSEEDLAMGMNVMDLLVRTDRPRAKENFGKIISQRKSSSGEYSALRKDGTTFDVLVISGPLAKNGQATGLRGVVIDISDRKRIENELQTTTENLRKSLGSLINVVATTVEVRDPYTSGHQKRVANLARTIATEMSLPKDKIEGIRIAGVIHDIGKISIPADILSKPGKLNEIEFALIRTHAEIGYEILKDIEFPWPVAQIVFQHHERLDGSGYPRGLRDGDIMLEARILSVADVVEAMASFRPYRPALGIERALDEITKNKGILYDPAVVDTCLRIFSEKKFKF